MRVTLEHSKHIYTDKKGQIYRSVSSFIAQYKQPFDPYKIMPNGKTLIANYVEKNGETEQYWLDKWNQVRDYACEKGHAFHDLKEMVVNNRGVHVSQGREMIVHNVNKLWQLPAYEGNFHLLPPGVYTELTLWNYVHRIAGTADLITIYPDKTFDIDDYKTNGTFKTEGFMNKPMKYPWTECQDCNLGHYTMQLSLYAWMLIQFGLKPRNLRLHHYDIPDKDVEKIIKQGILPDIEPTIYPVEYMEREVFLTMQERQIELKRLKRK